MSNGSIAVLRKVAKANAWVQDSSVEVTIEQPKKSFLKACYLRCTKAPTFASASGADLGFKIGNATGGNQIAIDEDGIIDGATVVTPWPEGGIVECIINELEAGGDSARPALYSQKGRTLYLNTTVTDVAVATNGDVEWILEFGLIED